MAWLWAHREINKQKSNLDLSPGWQRRCFVRRSFFITFVCLKNFSHLPPLLCSMAFYCTLTFYCKLRTTEQPSEVAHQPASCLWLQVAHRSFWASSSITFPGPQICKTINIASDQLFSRSLSSQPSQILSLLDLLIYCFSYQRSFLSTSYLHMFPLTLAVPRFFNDANHLLSLLFLSQFWQRNFFQLCSQTVQYALFSPLPQAVYASVLHSVYPPFFHLILKLHSTKSKQKARKPCIWPDHSSAYPPAKPSSSSLANSLRRANRSHSGNTPGAGNDCDPLSWLYLMSLEQSQALLSVYNINTPQATKT